MNEQDKTIRELCELNSIYQYEYIKDKRSCKSVREYRGILMRPVSVCEAREKEIMNLFNIKVEMAQKEKQKAIEQERENIFNLIADFMNNEDIIDDDKDVLTDLIQYLNSQSSDKEQGISLCHFCNCMTKTVNNQCGKCKEMKK